MKVCVIGAGFTGLAAGYYLSKDGIDVIIFEKEELPGGLATSFAEKKWKWLLEKHYHHLFSSDYAILNLADEIGHKVEFIKPKTSLYSNGKIYPFDSAISLLKFPEINLLDRLRSGATLAYLKLNPYWKPLEKITAYDFVLKTMGESAWRVIWEPLFVGKFGDKHTFKISAAWFWARIYKRTAKLGYPKGGFLSLANSIAKKVIEQGGVIKYNTGVLKISKVKNGIEVKTEDGKTFVFDKVVCTLPTHLFIKTVANIPKKQLQTYAPLQGVGAVNLVVAVKKPFFKDGTYWLNINDSKMPFLAVVEHTNLVKNKVYSKDKILYIGKYLESTHKYFSYSEKELLNEYLPYLKQLNKSFNKSWVRKAWIWKAPFAQPVIPCFYSKKVPSIKTHIKGLYLANIQQVYPWDRGTNYAVEMGRKVANLILNDTDKN